MGQITKHGIGSVHEFEYVTIGNQLLIAVGLGLDTNQFLDLTIWKPSEGMQPFYVIALTLKRSVVVPQELQISLNFVYLS